MIGNFPEDVDDTSSTGSVTDNIDDPSSVTVSRFPLNDDLDSDTLRECHACSNDITGSGSQCPGCTDVYCSESCLENAADWHARFCKNPRRPLTTADTLAAAAFDDMFPDDAQTNEDYFFTRTRTANDRTKLFGLYIGVLRYHDVNPSTLHQWRISGTLVENIKALYEPIPPNHRGGYFPWFLQNLDIFEPRPSALISLVPRHLCASCGVSAGVRCAACKNVWYCSKRCQRREWPGHLVDCNPGRPITSADRLRAAAHRKKVPQDQETSSDYGFNRVDEVGGKILLEIYRIVFEEGVRPRDLHQWKVSNRLLKEVESLLRPLEMWKTLEVMRWFENHRYALDSSMSIPEEQDSMEDRIEAAKVKLWNTVGTFPSQNLDEIYYAMKDWSKERVDVFYFRAMMGLCHPAPNLKYWVNFGFCACQDETEERFLNLTYQMLADRCSYDAFCTAYSNSTFTELLDATGLHGRRIALPYLEDVLSGSPRIFKSVWRLKQHVQDTNSVRSNIPMSIAVDYGFGNCASEDEYQDLKRLYTSIFERPGVNPLKLHEACISGELYEYVLGSFPELKNKKNRVKKFRRLLRNPYPLD